MRSLRRPGPGEGQGPVGTGAALPDGGVGLRRYVCPPLRITPDPGTAYIRSEDGTLPEFEDGEAMWTRRYLMPITPQSWEPLHSDVAARFAMVRSEYARARLPVLEERFHKLADLHRMNVVAMQPAPFFIPQILGFLKEAWSYSRR